MMEPHQKDWAGTTTMKLFYDVIYRYFRAPWDIGAREELVSLVEDGNKN